MPPKAKFTREEVLAAAISIVRESGMEAVTARSLADRLGTSAKPIFGLFENMNQLREEILARAYEIHMAYLEKEMAKNEYPPYKAGGMAYIRFASEEKELFRLLFMRERSGEHAPGTDEETMMMYEIIMRANGISMEKAKKLHFEMWVFVHGIASMLATGFCDVRMEDASSMLTDVYLSLRQKFITDEREETGK